MSPIPTFDPADPAYRNRMRRARIAAAAYLLVEAPIMDDEMEHLVSVVVEAWAPQAPGEAALDYTRARELSRAYTRVT